MALIAHPCFIGRRAFLQQVTTWGGLAALGAVAACRRAGQQSPGDQPVAAGPATVKVLTFSNPLFQQAADELLLVLAQEDPNLKPDVIVFPGQIDQFREKIATVYAGGDLPDAQWIHPSITSTMASRRLVRPLDELARRDRSTPLTEFYQGVLDYFRWNGVTYGLPWYCPGYVLVYNRDLFERLGVTLPDQLEREGKWTWDGFVTTLRSLTRGNPGSPDRTIGSQSHNMALDWACAWIWRNGGEVFRKDLKKCLLNEPPAVEAVQGLADLHLTYQVINYGPHTTDFPDGFNSGRVGLRQANKEAVAPERNDLSRAAFRLGMAPVYKGKAGRVNRMGPLAFGVVQESPRADAGWRWVRFMAGPQAAAVLMRRKSTLPVRPRFAQLPEFGQSMEPWEVPEIWLESMATARALPQPVNYLEVANLWMQTWQDILAQKGQVKALLDDLVRRVNVILTQE
jgi:multiple sugar transport system substrate-binding protein